MQGLKDDDFKAGQNLIDTLVLDRPDVHVLDIDSQGVILVTCGHCRHIGPIFKDRPAADLAHPPPRVMAIALNGGALPLATGYPSDQAKKEGGVTMECIREARQLLKSTTVALQAHFPCQATELYNFSLLQTIDLLVNAKARIKWELAGMKAACFLTLPGDNTYFVSQQKWERWRAHHRLMP